MSLLADFELKERVRAAVDLVDVASGLDLRRQGRNFVARCPWHDDRRPSLIVNPDRQTWKCWVCDIGGDVFSFVMRRDGVDFPEALKILAERAGITIEERGGVKKDGIDKAALLAVTHWAEQQFFEYLHAATEAEEARQYLAGRGINDDSRQRFRIGFAPDAWSWLLDRATAQGHAPKLLESAGLVVPRNSGQGFYDRFRGRVMFPIRDLQGRPIAFGGRVLPSASENGGAKYINSPETPLFSKSRQLYGLDLARDTITKQKNVLVMEGYTDVVLAHQFGVTSAVAVLGTALGEAHIKILRRYVDRVTLVLDGDAAGQRRADEVLELFVAADVDLRVATLPDNLDPADYLLRDGNAAFQQACEDAPDAIDHKLQRLTEGVDLSQDTHRATVAMETLLGLLARAPQGGATDLRVQQLLLRFSRTFGLPVDALRNRLNQLRQSRAESRSQPRTGAGLVEESKPNVEAVVVRSAPRDRLSGIDRELFEVLIESPHLVPQVLEFVDPAWLVTDSARCLLDTYQRLELDGYALDFSTLMLMVEEPHLKSTLVDLDQRVRDRQEKGAITSAEARLEAIQKRFQMADLSRTTDRQLADLETRQLQEQEELELLQQVIAAQRTRHGLPSR